MNKALNKFLQVFHFLFSLIQGIFLSFIPRKFREKTIKDEVVVITGGGDGLGKNIALQSAKLGAKIALIDVNSIGLKKTVKIIKKYGCQCHGYYCDMYEPQSFYKIADQIKHDFGFVSIVINCFNSMNDYGILDAEDHQIQKTIQKNTFPLFWLSKAFLPEMMEKNRGDIVSVTGLLGLTGFDRSPDYVASKFALIGFHEALHFQMIAERYTGINSKVISAGTHKTNEPYSLVKSEELASNIMSNILTSGDVHLFPSYFWIFNLFKSMLPSNCYVQLIKIFLEDVELTNYNFSGKHLPVLRITQVD